MVITLCFYQVMEGGGMLVVVLLSSLVQSGGQELLAPHPTPVI